MFAIIEYIYKFIDKFYFVLRIFLEIDRFLTPLCGYSYSPHMIATKFLYFALSNNHSLAHT
jgi:hypothetical protein